MTVQIRSFIDKDLSNLVKLLNKARRESYEFVPYSEEKFLSQVREWNLKILVAEEDGEVVGSVAYNNGHWGEEIEWLAVSEISSRKHLQDLLVRKIEEYVRGETIFKVIDAGSPRTDEWAERGYRPEGGLYQMTTKLKGFEPLPKVPEAVTLRSLKPKEEKKFVEAVNGGFGWERLKLGAIQEWKSRSPSFTEEWIHVAEVDNEIVSVVVSRLDEEYNHCFGGRRGYMGPATTLPHCRGKNLALALTLRAMNFLFKRGMDSVALYTSEDNVPSRALLRKLDFKISHHWKFMHKNLSKQE